MSFWVSEIVDAVYTYEVWDQCGAGFDGGRAMTVDVIFAR